MHRGWVGIAALLFAALSGCVSDTAVVGVYRNPEHGTITLGDDGNGSWNNVHIASWNSKDSVDVVFKTEDGVEYEGTLVDGVLLLDPGPGLGSESVAFTLVSQ